jgi:hypothetical protein
MILYNLVHFLGVICLSLIFGVYFILYISRNYVLVKDFVTKPGFFSFNQKVIYNLVKQDMFSKQKEILGFKQYKIS